MASNPAGVGIDRDKLDALIEPVSAPAHPYLQAVVNLWGAVLTVCCLGWALSVPQYLGRAFYKEQLLAVTFGCALCVVYHAVSWRGTRHRGLPWFDMALGWLGLAVCFWIAWDYQRLLLAVPNRTPEILILGAIVMLLSLEGLRRATGWTLLAVVLVFIAYAMVAHLAPVELRGRPVKMEQLLVYLAFDPSAIFGSSMVIGATIVLMFLWMGDVLMRAGGGEFFKDIAMAFLGKKRGGPAKICVVGSGLFGMISGSAVSNVASVGVFTIPMMKRTGYSARDAGAIEAVGSTGGQLMPPVMGAAAFLMAEFLEVPYAEVALAAAIPAALYYFGLYVQVDLIAAKEGHQKMTERIPAVAEVMREGWHLCLPFAVLLFTMFYWEESPEVSAIGATVAIFAVGFVRPYKGKKLTLGGFLESFAATGRTSTDLFMTLAAAGMVIGVLNITGLGFALTLWLVTMAGESLYILLLIAFLVSMVLGMGMPTTAVYVLLAALVAPSLVEAGVHKMAAHMFILYCGMLSMITPPVAIAAYAAANISGAGPMETGWAAVRIGWVKFVVPFVFVLSPTLLAIGDPAWVAYDSVTALFGVYFVTAAMIGYFRRSMDVVKRFLLLVAGLAAWAPASEFPVVAPGVLSGLGLALGLVVLIFEMMATRKVGVVRTQAV